MSEDTLRGVGSGRERRQEVARQARGEEPQRKEQATSLWREKTMTQQCPPHTWSATPLKDERGKAIFECSKCGTSITVDCKYLTKAEVTKCAATPEAAA
jgi:transcription elongation factor Elf1